MGAGMLLHRATPSAPGSKAHRSPGEGDDGCVSWHAQTVAFAVFLSLALFCTMLALGLGLHSSALRSWLLQPSLPLRILLGSCVLVPLAGLLLLLTPWSRSLPEVSRFAIALMALCPSAPLALRKARKAGGDHQLAALIQVAAALSAIVCIPLLGLLFRQLFLVEGWLILPRTVALQVFRVQVLPLLLGLALRHWRPRLADVLERPLNRVANLLLLLVVALVLFKTGPALLQLLSMQRSTLPIMALLAVASLVIGWAMAGPAQGHGVTTALVTGMRNPGLAILLAQEHGQALKGLKLSILLYVLVSVVVSAPLLRRSARMQA